MLKSSTENKWKQKKNGSFSITHSSAKAADHAILTIAPSRSGKNSVKTSWIWIVAGLEKWEWRLLFVILAIIIIYKFQITDHSRSDRRIVGVRFSQTGCPSCQHTNGVKTLKGRQSGNLLFNHQNHHLLIESRLLQEVEEQLGAVGMFLRTDDVNKRLCANSNRQIPLLIKGFNSSFNMTCLSLRQEHSLVDGVSMFQPQPSGTRFHHIFASVVDSSVLGWKPISSHRPTDFWELLLKSYFCITFFFIWLERPPFIGFLHHHLLLLLLLL